MNWWHLLWSVLAAIGISLLVIRKRRNPGVTMTQEINGAISGAIESLNAWVALALWLAALAVALWVGYRVLFKFFRWLTTD